MNLSKACQMLGMRITTGSCKYYLKYLGNRELSCKKIILQDSCKNVNILQKSFIFSARPARFSQDLASLAKNSCKIWIFLAKWFLLGYRIMQIVRGGKLSRLHNLVVIRGKTFAIVQQFETPYNKKEKIRWKTFAIGG